MLKLTRLKRFIMFCFVLASASLICQKLPPDLEALNAAPGRNKTEAVSLSDICELRENIISTSTAGILRKIHGHRPLQIYIGSGGCQENPGFISLLQSEFDVTKSASFENTLCKASVDTFLTEHTFEHIPYEDAANAFRLIFEYLKPGGLFRIAVPNDGRAGKTFVPSKLDEMIGHVSAYNFGHLQQMLKNAGFRNIRLVEEQEKFNETTIRIQATEWDFCEGKVHRTLKHDWRNEPLLKSLYAVAKLDGRNQIGENTVYYHKEGELKGRITVENTGVDGRKHVSLIHGEAVPYLELADKLKRQVNDPKQAAKCEANALAYINKTGYIKNVGWPPTISLVVDARK